MIYRSFLLIILMMFYSPIYAKEMFSKDTKMYWTVVVTIDGEKKTYSGGEIDKLLKSKITHSKLKVSCNIPLEREFIKYDPKTSTYTRDEERSVPVCDYNGTKIKLGRVLCAKGHAKNKVGTIYGDDAEIHLEKNDSQFSMRLICIVK